MKVIIAPDSFKGSLSAIEVADHIEKGILSVFPGAEIIKVPMADGGEGTVQTLVDATGGKIIRKKVTGPIGEKVEAYFGILGNKKTAIIEMATASGLTLLHEDKKNPLLTTTYGTGELIAYALNYDVEEIIIGIGGSATNDAGVGMAQALGVSFTDENGEEIGFGGGELKRIKNINMNKLDKRIKDITVRVACDVTNPLYGPEGAAYIYGPQKGATLEQVEYLDENLKYISTLIKEQFGVELQSIPGTGAAGGLGAGIVVFLNGKLSSGLDIVLKAYDFDKKLHGVDLVITGEGKIDTQTINGKVPIGVAKMAKKHDVTVIAIAGIIEYEAYDFLKSYIDSIYSISQGPVSIQEAMSNTAKWIEITTIQIMNTLKNK